MVMMDLRCMKEGEPMGLGSRLAVVVYVLMT